MSSIYDDPNYRASGRVNRPGGDEVVRQRLYDYQLYPTAGQGQLTFFALPIGQGITSALGAAVGSPKTYADTNMQSAGQLPAPVSYVVESIEIDFQPGGSAAANTMLQISPVAFAAVAAAALLAAVADVAKIRQSGWLEFYIGSKTYLYEAPLGVFPPKVRMEIDGAIGNNSATTGDLSAVVGRWAGRPYIMDPYITLDSLQNFAVYTKWPGVVSTADSGFNARIGVAFDGVLYRLSQ
jgi:hypothetical protein